MPPVSLSLLALAAMLFLASNWIGRHTSGFGYSTIDMFQVEDRAPAFNLAFRILAPQVFLVIVATIMAKANAPFDRGALWSVTLWSFVGRWMFNILRGRAALVGWPRQILIASAATYISYWLATDILRHEERFLPDAANIRTEIWVVVSLFLFQIANNLTVSTVAQEKRQEIYLANSYYGLKRRFNNVVESSAPDRVLEALIYAIMIVECFNRPAIYQRIERWILFPLGFARSLGPMQVRSNSRLSDVQSVQLGSEKISALFSEKRSALVEGRRGTEWQDDLVGVSELGGVVYDVAHLYNPSSVYADHVVDVFWKLVSRFYPDLNDDRSAEQSGT